MAEEEETIGDVLTRVSALKKDEMVTEVESYGLEVKSDWTKDEIMDHFEQFLTSPEAVDPQEAPVPDEAPPSQDEGDAALFVAQQQEAEPPTPPTLPPTSDVRITSTQSPGWGTTPTAKAP